jgi:endo-1,4-beta-xylanase
MSKKISRRDFLKLAGVTSAGLALSACGVKAIESPTATFLPPTETIIPTITSVPTSTLMPTPKPPETLREYADALGIEIGGSQTIGYFQNWHVESTKMKPFFLENFNLFGNAWDCLWENPYAHLSSSKTTFDFEQMDLYVDFLQKNKLKGQVLLIWGYKRHLPEWLLKGNFKEPELMEILENHISTLVGRYKGKIQEYSVVNEILGNPWEKGNAFWYDHLDKNLDWVKKCFQWANQADPNATLLLNDFGIEFPGFYLYEKGRDDFDFNLIRDIKDSGIPIHGVAFQMHLNAFKNFYPETNISSLMDGLYKNIEKYQNLGVDVYVTEFDLVLAGLNQLTIDEKYDLQAKVYGSVLDTCLSAGVKSFTLFNLIDRLSWLDEQGGENPPYSGKDADPCAWDDNYQPKPAYYAMMDVMKKHYQQRNS